MLLEGSSLIGYKSIALGNQLCRGQKRHLITKLQPNSIVSIKSMRVEVRGALRINPETLEKSHDDHKNNLKDLLREGVEETSDKSILKDDATSTWSETGKTKTKNGGSVVVVDPKPRKGFTSKAVDWLEKVLMNIMYDSSQSHYWLFGNFAPVDETPPCKDLDVIGYLPECLNGEFVRVGPNPKFAPVAGYHWFDGDGMIHGLRIKDGKATYLSRYVRTSRLKQEEYFGGPKFRKIGDLKGFLGLVMVYMQMLRTKLKVIDLSYGDGTGNTALIYHHGKLLALSEGDKPYAIKVLEDGDLQTLGLMDYDKRLSHAFTAHPKIDPVTGEMFMFGYAQAPPFVTYRVISKNGVMNDPVPITVAESIMMHDFAITENYAIFMDLPLYFRPKEMVTEKKFSYTFDATKKARFGILPRYAKNELQIKWFELPNCFIFHSANAWEEGDEVVLIACRLQKPNLEMVGGRAKEKLENFANELYEMRFNLKTGFATQKKLSESAVDFPRVNENYTGRKQRFVYATMLDNKQNLGLEKKKLKLEEMLKEYTTLGLVDMAQRQSLFLVNLELIMKKMMAT